MSYHQPRHVARNYAAHGGSSVRRLARPQVSTHGQESFSHVESVQASPNVSRCWEHTNGSEIFMPCRYRSTFHSSGSAGVPASHQRGTRRVLCPLRSISERGCTGAVCRSALRPASGRRSRRHEGNSTWPVDELARGPISDYDVWKKAQVKGSARW